jgi:hypothetical protein
VLQPEVCSKIFVRISNYVFHWTDIIPLCVQRSTSNHSNHRLTQLQLCQTVIWMITCWAHNLLPVFDSRKTLNHTFLLNVGEAILTDVLKSNVNSVRSNNCFKWHVPWVASEGLRDSRPAVLVQRNRVFRQALVRGPVLCQWRDVEQGSIRKPVKYRVIRHPAILKLS